MKAFSFLDNTAPGFTYFETEILQMTIREALNSALDEEMSADPKVFLMGEEVMGVAHSYPPSSFSLIFPRSHSLFRYF